jgi:hypothetical protein
MPRPVQPLTQLQVRNARPKEKPYRLFDGSGLYLEVTPTGSKLWRMKFRQPGGKENRLSFGVFPEVSLADARARRDQARQLLASGADPARARDEQARRARLDAQNTFEHVARLAQDHDQLMAAADRAVGSDDLIDPCGCRLGSAADAPPGRQAARWASRLHRAVASRRSPCPEIMTIFSTSAFSDDFCSTRSVSLP